MKFVETFICACAVIALVTFVGACVFRSYVYATHPVEATCQLVRH